jgi:serine acetyltransferase
MFLGEPIVSLKPDSVLEIGDGAVLCSDSRFTALGVSHPVVLRTLLPKARLLIGTGAKMSGVTVCAANSVEIGPGVYIGADAIIADTNFHSLDPEVRNSERDEVEAVNSPTKVGKNAFIGARAMVLKGVDIGEGSVVGSGSIVTKSVEPWTIVAGNPAKAVGMVRQP